MPDVWEQRFLLDINNANDAPQDLDGDGLSNLQEYKSCTGPNTKDTDDDGIIDGQEVDQGLDPNDPENRADEPVAPGDPEPCPVCEEQPDHLFWICLILLILVIFLLLLLFLKGRR